MTPFEIYVLLLCIIVYALLVVVFAFAITIIVKLMLRLIRCGADDDKIIEEYEKNKLQPKKRFKFVEKVLYVLMCVAFGAVFAASLFMSCTQKVYFEGIPTYRVVQTGSMEKKYEKNYYLFNNNLNDQIQTFDLILTYKVPKEEDLKLYDIVVYEVDDVLIVHRIVGIEEPNAQHPNQRYFLLQGDAVSSADRFPVLYSQLRGIYKGERVPFVGSFVLFMQSPAGWLCIMLVAASIILTPILERKLEKERNARYLLLNPPTEDEQTITEDEVTEELVVDDIKDELIDLVNEKTIVSRKTFYEKLEFSSDIVKARYNKIREFLCRIKGVRLIEGKTQHSYKCKSTPIARLTFRGKTLNAFLGLDTKDYENSKYIFTDLSSSKKHVNYPMRVKLSSERQTRWTIELLNELVVKNGLTLLPEPVEIKVTVPNGVIRKRKGKDMRSFDQIINSLPIAKERYNLVKDAISISKDVRLIEGRKQKTYKFGNTPIARFVMRGNILNVYFNAIAENFVDDHYIYKNVSSILSHTNYPIRIPLTSEVQTEFAVELIHKIYHELGVLGVAYEN